MNCFKHVQNREQEGDSQIPIDYLVELDKNYKIMFADLNCKKFIVNGNDTIENIHKQIVNIINNAQV